MKQLQIMLMSSLLVAIAAGQVSAQQGDDGDERRRRRERVHEMMSRDDGAPKVGEQAPVFKLKSLDGNSETDLSGFRAKRPVILFFGSYT